MEAASDSSQYLSAWRSEESRQRAEECQSEAQPGDGKSAKARSEDVSSCQGARRGGITAAAAAARREGERGKIYSERDKVKRR